MPFRIAIASGKGGTGKTTVSVNLFNWIRKHWTDKVQLVDCDVEEPNDHIFLPEYLPSNEKEITQLIPKIDTNNCTFCRKCVEWCEFNAIVIIPPAKFAEINNSLCHSCGACLEACNDNAIIEQAITIGKETHYINGNDLGLLEGELKIGSAMQTRVIAEIKKDINLNAEIVIFDAPPGTSCPVVETVSDTDYVILVTEPTPFGLHDLKLTVALLREINIEFGVIVNKSGLGTDDVYHYLKNENIELLGKIPFSKEYASIYSRGKILNQKEFFLDQYNVIGSILKNKIK
jgi:MinD superfamily P-loop ATPase